MTKIPCSNSSFVGCSNDPLPERSKRNPNVLRKTLLKTTLGAAAVVKWMPADVIGKQIKRRLLRLLAGCEDSKRLKECDIIPWLRDLTERRQGEARGVRRPKRGAVARVHVDRVVPLVHLHGAQHAARGGGGGELVVRSERLHRRLGHEHVEPARDARGRTES